MIEFLENFLTAQLIVSAVTIAVVVHVILGGVAYSVYLERKISAYIQDRLGPNRVGFDFGLPALSFLKGMWGLGQSLADGIKFLLKEDFTPARVDKVLFSLAPIVVVIPALMGFIIIPWGGVWDIPTFTIPLLNVTVEGGPVTVAGADTSVGILYAVAIAALGVYGITLGGYASNNKYSFLGGLRATAQMISYEIPLGLALLAVILVVGSLRPIEILNYQNANGWLLFSQPVAGVILFIAMLAEANRAPFDNAEAEQELVGGYHTEYSSMRFALYFLAEYSHLITSSAIFTMLFLGAFEPIPFVTIWGTEATGFLAVLAKVGIFAGKTATLVAFAMVIRWTIPRMRYDQIMTVAWNAVIPLAMLMIVTLSVMVYLGQRGLVPMLAANVGMVIVALLVSPFMPKTTANKRIPLYGSRFSPMAGEAVNTRPTDPMALEDRPVQGSLPTAGR